MGVEEAAVEEEEEADEGTGTRVDDEEVVGTAWEEAGGRMLETGGITALEMAGITALALGTTTAAEVVAAVGSTPSKGQ